jgi:hypothetical protein
MDIPTLGTLSTLRAADVWKHEAQVFTPWLADNLHLLAHALQTDELNLKGTEVAAGDFRLDVLAEDQGGNPVIIENQFGSTDHKHLGQLLSYLASLGDHATVVWIAEKVREEHRAAVDWLNAHTTDGFDFFALEIEALQIGDSLPAPFFNVVAKPNNWARSVSAISRQSATGELAERHKIRLAYWASFAEFLRVQAAPFSIRRPIKMSYCDFRIRKRGVVISTSISTEKRRAGVSLYFQSDPMKLAINRLRAELKAIEREFGEKLEWRDMAGKKASAIATYQFDVDPRDPAAYLEIHRWMLDRMQRFERVFVPRLKNSEFDAEQLVDEEADDT